MNVLEANLPYESTETSERSSTVWLDQAMLVGHASGIKDDEPGTVDIRVVPGSSLFAIDEDQRQFE